MNLKRGSALSWLGIVLSSDRVESTSALRALGCG